MHARTNVKFVRVAAMGSDRDVELRDATRCVSAGWLAHAPSLRARAQMSQFATNNSNFNK